MWCYITRVMYENGSKSKMTDQQGNFQSTQKIKFNKTETEYNMKSIRFLLLTITGMFLVIASLMIVMGISIYTHYHGYSYFYESAKSSKFFTPSVLSVIIGVFIMVITSFGFFGTMKLSTCMANLYALFLSVVLILEMVVVILAFTLDKEIIMKYIDVPVWAYAEDREIQAEIDQLQNSLNCCGSDSYMDYYDMKFTNHSTVTIPAEIDDQRVSIALPESCCINAIDSICTRLRSTGCKHALVSLVVQNAGVLGVLGVSVMFIQLLGIIFSLLLARSIRKFKSEKALLTWKAKEQMIIARQQIEAQKDDPNSVYIVRPDSSVA